MVVGELARLGRVGKCLSAITGGRVWDLSAKMLEVLGCSCEVCCWM